MTKIKKQDFIEIEYTGQIKDDNLIFDTTDEKTAKENEIFDENAKYGPIVICVGEGNVIKGLDQFLEGKDIPSEHEVDIEPDNGFGRKNPQHVKMIPTNKFTKQNITPMPGLQVNIDGLIGIIKTVGGGRTIVDFNHPLASKILAYKLKINKIVTDDKEKTEAYLKIPLGSDIQVTEKEGNYEVESKQDIPEKLQNSLKENAKKLIPSVKDIKFTKKNK
ncbi:peptidylprolyl isomerase [Nanoarchaeota archaeon]